MDSHHSQAEAEDQGDVFLDDSDIIQEIPIDEEGKAPIFFCQLLGNLLTFYSVLLLSDLPDADDEQGSDAEDLGKKNWILFIKNEGLFLGLLRVCPFFQCLVKFAI